MTAGSVVPPPGAPVEEEHASPRTGDEVYGEFHPFSVGSGKRISGGEMELAPASTGL